MKFVANMVLLVLLLPSCQKDKLEGSAAALVGKWKWDYSYEFISGNNQTTMNKINASDFPDEYFMEFSKNGKLTFLKNDAIIERYNLTFQILKSVENPNSDYDVLFDCLLDKNLNLSGRFSADSIETGGRHLPLEPHTSGSLEYSYGHYYSKVK